MRSFYQDRLGTNIGTALKKTTVCNIPCVSPKLVLANKRLSSRYSNTATTKTNGPFFLAQNKRAVFYRTFFVHQSSVPSAAS